VTATAMRPASPTADADAGVSWRDDLRAVEVVWKREMVRFVRNGPRMLTSFAQPLLFLLVLGSGLSSAIKGAGGLDYRTFMFPGVITMTILFTAIFSAISIVWDREFGFLREMLVAPVRRGAIVVGKCAGGASIATLQALVILALAGLVGVPYSVTMFLTLIPMMVLTAVMLTAFGLAISARMTQIESFQVVMQLVVMPMFFLAGVMFPLTGLPKWLETATRFDPLTYAVGPMRHVVLTHVDASPAALRRFDPAITWGGWELPVAVQLLIVAALAVLFLVIAIRQFDRAE
jgi:ABC-2 type transport system permease protein